ncbi:M1 family metallopeptidase [Chryseobacterium potabilaquae]|uniref:Peptidase M1 membrane alanine aminopeptidase domain-containing protein n=1 Tax=Chryseobacterium potabilaquae TaxID=2675057 RepID=A0A6N4XBA2_9FLAO|nr:M1 family metallopeptidase [Chryseobacterium potabilaquae]CAA7196276.1 hypothetical protein CHRY9293_02383 [Chryseobacterium potabilaquae]
MKKSVTILFAFIISQFQAQPGNYYQQSAKYKMNIDVDAEKFTYQGEQTLEYTNNSPDELKVVYFHLYWNAFKPNSMMDQRVSGQGKNGDSRLQKDGVSRLASIPKNEEGSQNIHWIKQNGKELKFEIQETIMKVYLAESIKPNSTTTFTMDWDAVIPQQIRRSGRNNREGVDMTMTQWYPKIAEYDYDGWATFDYIGREFHAPFADFEVAIKINKDYVIGAGGILENPQGVKGYESKPLLSIDKNNKVTWRWTAKNILDFAWSADKDYKVKSFDVPEGPKVFLVYQQNNKTKAWEEAQPYVTKYFQIMNSHFGKYIYPTYTFIQGGDGGMEYGMCTMILGEAQNIKDLMGLMAHEGAHSWYQQMLATNESMRPWMDEGFTSYAEGYTMHQLFPEDLPNPFIKTLDSYRAFIKKGIEEPAVWLGDHHDNGSAYTYASYVKGELYLVQLGYIMGEQKLAEVLKQYYDQWSMRHPSDRDFLHIAQKVSGMDLKWFHNYWINTTKTIDYGIKDIKYDTKSTTIILINKGQVPMPIDFSVMTTDKKIITYQIPLNMTHTWKDKDMYGDFSTMPYWPWTQKEYTLTIPYTKSQLYVLGIDFSQRIADINMSDNFIEVK